MPDNEASQEDTLSGQLRQLVLAIEAGGMSILPRSNDALLQSIVDVAAKIFNAAAASILLVNEKEQVLEFKVAYGASNRDLVGMKFPIDKGIAGYVVLTGQPLTVSNVRQDPRFNQDFAKSTGYVPNSILATPLIVEDRVIGVMEVLDKIGATSFGMGEMELMSMFANQAAIAINQSRHMESISDLLVAGIKKLSGEDPALRADVLVGSLADIGACQPVDDLQVLAGLFYKLSTQGEAERKACLAILNVFAEYKSSSHRSWS